MIELEFISIKLVFHFFQLLKLIQSIVLKIPIYCSSKFNTSLRKQYYEGFGSCKHREVRYVTGLTSPKDQTHYFNVYD